MENSKAAEVTAYNNGTTKKGAWITDGAWISGLAGVVSLFVVALVCQRYAWLDKGVSLWGVIDLNTKLDVQLFCLIIIALSMCFVELLRLFYTSATPRLTLAPVLAEGRYLELIFTCLWRYVCYLALFYFLVFIYKFAPEYGFVKNNPYYQPWFQMCDWLLRAFTWLGFPYVLLTYACKYDESKDKQSYHHLIEYALFPVLARLGFKFQTSITTQKAKNTLLGLLVRAFFAPLMTVFFVEQFGHLVSNFGYLFDWLPRHIANGNYNHAALNKDLMNILKPVIFSIDVSLAWCGYVLTSRWLDNETQSTEPSLLGWFVCLISYPPFQLAGLYFIFPSENQILSLSNHYFVTFFTVLTLLSFIFYTASTVVFGVRFSNLTHRGIIRTGPFSIIRHPAYTSKNIGWWLGIFPVLLFLLVTGALTFTAFGLMTMALVAQSYWYYWRAITEERHLSLDPLYQEYCKQVKYRFIPKIF